MSCAVARLTTNGRWIVEICWHRSSRHTTLDKLRFGLYKNICIAVLLYRYTIQQRSITIFSACKTSPLTSMLKYTKVQADISATISGQFCSRNTYATTAKKSLINSASTANGLESTTLELARGVKARASISLAVNITSCWSMVTGCFRRWFSTKRSGPWIVSCCRRQTYVLEDGLAWFSATTWALSCSEVKDTEYRSLKKLFNTSLDRASRKLRGGMDERKAGKTKEGRPKALPMASKMCKLVKLSQLRLNRKWCCIPTGLKTILLNVIHKSEFDLFVVTPGRPFIVRSTTGWNRLVLIRRLLFYASPWMDRGLSWPSLQLALLPIFPHTRRPQWAGRHHRLLTRTAIRWKHTMFT